MSEMAKATNPNLSDELTLYLAAMHDVIAAYHQHLSEVTSPRVANQFLANVSDMSMKYVEGRDSAMDAVKKRLMELGVNLTMRQMSEDIRSEIQCEIECPFASKVHPLIVSKAPICPIAIAVLGAVRTKQSGALATKLELNEKGTRAVIHPNPVKAS
jgi:hypothetical protein